MQPLVVLILFSLAVESDVNSDLMLSVEIFRAQAAFVLKPERPVTILKPMDHKRQPYLNFSIMDLVEVF